MIKRKNVRVLIAEDDHMVGEMITGLLEKMGYEVVGEASDGSQAVELTQSLRPDVVLMDIQMPYMDGIEAAGLINDHCPTPIVVLTAYESLELVEKASAAGAGAYLVKPPNAREIERAITVAMARFDDMVQLRRLNAELRASNAELDAFAHTVAHDLKNPLTLTMGLAEALLENYATMPREELQNYLSMIARNGRKMAEIIKALLLLAQVQPMEVEMAPLDMARIMAETLQRLAMLIKEHQPTIIQPDHWLNALGYGPWVEEVWANYLSNAIQYGGRPNEGLAPRLELGCDVSHLPPRLPARPAALARATRPQGATVLEKQGTQPQGMIRFWVRDNGMGISPENQRRLFIPFVRLPQTRLLSHGLGLSIVRRIVEKLGGQVGVESEVGVGSTFWFTLPAA